MSPGDPGHHLGHGEDELRGAGVLLHLPVDLHHASQSGTSTGSRDQRPCSHWPAHLAAELEVVRVPDLVPGHDGGADGGEVLHRLAQQPLAAILLQLPVPGVIRTFRINII